MEENNNLIIGRNAVHEAVRTGREIDFLYVQKGERSGSIGMIVAKAVKAGVVIKEVPGTKLDFLTAHGNHQGIAAVVPAHTYATVEDILAVADQRNEPPFIVIADGLEDPHNLGAVIRTAECAGAHGVIIPKRRSVSLTPAVSKAAAGALEYVPVAKVTNITNTIEDLKKRGLWIFGADMQGEQWYEPDMKVPLALVIGGENTGISRLVREKCDVILSLPLNGKISSLNASVACGIILYEIARQRL